MDEVDAMTRAGESVGKAVRSVRRGAVRAGHVGADAAVQLAHNAEDRLAERGLTKDYVRGVVADKAGVLVEKAEEVEKSTRRGRKQLAKRARGVRKDVLKAAERARKEAKVRAKQARRELTSAKQPQRRRWPWVLGVFAAAAVAGYIALTKRPQEVHLQEEDVEPTPESTGTAENTESLRPHAARNGQVSDQHSRS
ncbi:hypothetical protein ALI22I_38920 [Saccharothrix sp. ALI-22-I]|uniref:hypothetical protein n=1 Tax=Saccharothrix sp. ALI-22-I TaxID=1933778 RepID=UPI0009CA084B|nr:hypothetical protein [Saccharothrix sp. ALI-22-I]ONI82126.1 hypothetical protein ALI22I_38920 [Saccharothrix sp. ALI-22-I]